MVEYKTKRLLILVLSVIGIGISSYLAYAKLTNNPLECGLDAGCSIVQDSEYSTLFGIPLGVFGMFYYFVLFSLFYSNEELIKKYKLRTYWVLWGIAFSTYLTYLEAFVINAFCKWCLGSFFNILIIGGIHFVSTKKPKDLEIPPKE